MPKLVPITQEEIRLLKGFDRAEALRLYYAWLKAERENDLRELHNLDLRIGRFKVRKTQIQNKYKKGFCIECNEKTGGKYSLRCKPCHSNFRKGKPTIHTRGSTKIGRLSNIKKKYQDKFSLIKKNTKVKK